MILKGRRLSEYFGFQTKKKKKNLEPFEVSKFSLKETLPSSHNLLGDFLRFAIFIFLYYKKNDDMKFRGCKLS